MANAKRRLRLALMWRGNPAAPSEPTRHLTRLQPLADALATAGVEVEPVAYFDEELDDARARLLRCDGVMVWVNPLQDGQDRSRLNPMLAEVASAGVWVSAHPDIILAMGTKEVLFRTRELGWGTDTHLYRTFEAFEAEFPLQLQAGAARVLKPNRGNDGQGVWKVQPAGREIAVQAAADDHVEVLPLPDFIARCRGHFAGDGLVIDQPFQSRVGEGMVRCYLSQNRVVGFSEQWPRIKDARSGTPALGMDSTKTMHGPAAPRFMSLRRAMEETWLPGMLRTIALSPADLPAIWDADFLLGPRDAAGEDSYVLCEINISSVLPFPDIAVGDIARTAVGCMETARRARAR